MQERVRPLLGFDKGGNHGAPGGRDDHGIGPGFPRQPINPRQHLGNPLRRGYFCRRFLEPGGLANVVATLGDQGNQFAVDAVDLLAHLVERGTLDKAGHGISFLRDTKTKRPQDFLAAALKNWVKKLLIHLRPQTSGNAPCARQAAQVHYGDRAGGGNHGTILQG
jgi:hypothetical protein